MALRTFLVSTILALVSVSIAHSQQATTVEVGDFFFCDKSSASTCETIVAAGDEVIWSYGEGSAGHTVTFCGESCDEPVELPLFDSGKLLAGETFAFTLDEPGAYLYYCEFHPVAMRGSIVVQPQVTSAPVDPSETPEPTPAIEPTGTVEPSPAPRTDDPPRLTASPTPPGAALESEASEDGGADVSLIALIAIVAAIAVLGVSLLAFRRLRG